MIFIFRLITLDKTVMILADYQAEAERKLLEIFGPMESNEYYTFDASQTGACLNGNSTIVYTL